MNLFGPHITDGYKLGHPSQYAQGTSSVSSNFTPRDFGYANVLDETKTGKYVYAGLQYAVKEYLINVWNNSFFSKPKAEVMARYARRIKGYLGEGQGAAAQDLMSRIHDLGYLPLRIKSLPEGSRVNAGIPVFTVTCSKPDLEGHAAMHGLVNYVETVLSCTVWPICNAASLSEQYYLLAKKYGEQTGASAEFWLPFSNHNFAFRGHRGVEDAIISAFGHSLFFKGTDTFIVADFAEEYYNANTDEEMIAVSVNATEHATVCQQIAVHGGGHDGELGALNHFLTEVYPTGILSYVSDSRDYWDVITNILPKLKDVIVSRGASANGQPGILTLRPDSSPDTPYEILLGYKVFDMSNDTEWTEADLESDDAVFEFMYDEYSAVNFHGKLFAAHIKDKKIVLRREISEAEAKGTFAALWDIFGGEEVCGGYAGVGRQQRMYRLLDPHIRVIYGEAISLTMAQKIYRGMMQAGWCVGNVLFGIGSWAFLANSSRDSYGVACKATNSEVNGVDFPLQKDPKGTSSFKKSAKGRLRVEYDAERDVFVLFDNQTKEDEEKGELKVVFEDGQMVKEEVFKDMVARLLK